VLLDLFILEYLSKVISDDDDDDDDHMLWCTVHSEADRSQLSV